MVQLAKQSPNHFIYILQGKNREMKFILGIVLLVGLLNCPPQRQVVDKKNLIGLWQFGSKEVNAGFFDTYQFFANGSFKFNTNQNDATRRIISIGGTYEIKNNLLLLKTIYNKEIHGGILVRSETEGGSGWELSGGKIITTKYKSPKESTITIERCETEEECILLDSRKYYQVEKDPNNFN